RGGNFCSGTRQAAQRLFGSETGASDVAIKPPDRDRPRFEVLRGDGRTASVSRRGGAFPSAASLPTPTAEPTAAAPHYRTTPRWWWRPTGRRETSRTQTPGFDTACEFAEAHSMELRGAMRIAGVAETCSYRSACPTTMPSATYRRSR